MPARIDEETRKKIAEEVAKLGPSWKTYEQVAEMFNVSPITVRKIAAEYGIVTNDTRRKKSKEELELESDLVSKYVEKEAEKKTLKEIVKDVAKTSTEMHRYEWYLGHRIMNTGSILDAKEKLGYADLYNLIVDAVEFYKNKYLEYTSLKEENRYLKEKCKALQETIRHLYDLLENKEEYAELFKELNKAATKYELKVEMIAKVSEIAMKALFYAPLYGFMLGYPPEAVANYIKQCLAFVGIPVEEVSKYLKYGFILGEANAKESGRKD